MIQKELNAGLEDLAEAEAGLIRESYKWATIQAYYAVFHGMRALLFRAGLREESHAAMKAGIWELYVEKGILNAESFRCLERGMELRELADYKSTFSANTATWLVENTKKSLQEIQQILGLNN